MPRRRRRRVTNKKSSVIRSKPVKLDKSVWVSGTKATAQYRASKLIEQDGLCAVSFKPISEANSVADHSHCYSGCGDYNVEGKCRGILLSEINLIEGAWLRVFKKSKIGEKYGLTYPELLANMGAYLMKDNSKEPYHPEYYKTLRKHINRLNREQIADKIRKEFKLEACATEPKGELVQRYVQAFIHLIERREHEQRRTKAV